MTSKCYANINHEFLDFSEIAVDIAAIVSNQQPTDKNLSKKNKKTLLQK